MQFTIRATATGVEIVDKDGLVVATFEGTLNVAYQEAVAHLGGLFSTLTPPPPDATDGLLPERWVDVDGIALNKALPGGRDFTPCEWSFRPPPRPLMLQTKNLPAHMEAELAGFADEEWIADDGIPHASGRFYDSDAGRQARDILLDGRTFGVSVDPSENVSVEEGCGEWAEDDVFGPYCAQPLAIFTAYEIAGLTMVPFEGFDTAAIKLATADDTTAAPDTSDSTTDDNQDDADTVDDKDKLTQAAVHYDAKGGTDTKKCELCAHYDDGHCAIVQDPIVPAGVCDHFVADADADADEPDDASDKTAPGPDDSGGPNDMPPMTSGWDDGWELAGVTADDRKKYGMKDGSYPVKNCQTGPGSVDAAIKAVGRGKGDHNAIRRHIMARAKALGCSSQIPENWQSDGTIKASVAASALAAPPRAWFEMEEPRLGVPFDGDLLGDDVLVPQYEVVRDVSGRFQRWGDRVLGYAVPQTITDDRRVYGHLTYWGQCHIGNPWGVGRCASASPSTNGYRDFYGSGYVVCDDGSELSCGLFHVGCEHSTVMDVRGVRDAAAHAGLAYAQVRVMDGEYGPWYCGRLLPTVTDEQVEALRALTPSGEWVPELGAVIAVNDGGYPQQRRDRIAASNGNVYVVGAAIRAASVKDGRLVKLIGGNTVRPCPECAKRARAARAEQAGPYGQRLAALEALMDQAVLQLDTLVSRTQHLNAAAADDLIRRRLARDDA